MDVNMSDQEQIQAIKDWWKKYGTATIVAIALAVGGNFGWSYYKHRQLKHSEYASMLYTKMLSSYAENNTSEFKAQANYLTENYSNVPYSTLANFALAKEFISKGKLDDALDKLNDVIKNESEIRLKHIAQIRKARILLAQDKPDAALAALTSVDEKSFMPLVNEVRGDIFVAKGEQQKARQEYQAALKAMPLGEVNRALLQMKFDQLAAPENGIV